MVSEHPAPLTCGIYRLALAYAQCVIFKLFRSGRGSLLFSVPLCQTYKCNAVLNLSLEIVVIQEKEADPRKILSCLCKTLFWSCLVVMVTLLFFSAKCLKYLLFQVFSFSSKYSQIVCRGRNLQRTSQHNSLK